MEFTPRRLTLRVPSTTANLGPGFDCLGLALQQENRWTLEVRATPEGKTGRLEVVECQGEGQTTLPRDGSHLFFATWRRLAESGHGPDLVRALLHQGWSVALRAENVTPLARGLGSSAALRVASAEAYRRLSGRMDLVAWQLAAALEGHPDNAAPAGLGGLVCGLVDEDGRFQALAQEIHACWLVAVAVPEFSLLTAEARRALPRRYPRAACLHNLSRLPFLLHGLRSGQAEAVRRGCQDQLHQPYRAPLIPGFEAVCQAALEHGAAASFLSGAGPSVAAFVDRRSGAAQAVVEAMHQAFLRHGVSSRTHLLEVDDRGLVVEEDTVLEP